MNATIGLARHGKRTTRMSPQEIFKYRLQNPATTPPVTTQPHNLDVRGNAKPTGRVYINSKTIWFTLYRIARPGHVSEGQWIPITRTMAVTPSRRKIVNRLCKAQAEAREQLAAEMLQAGRAQQEKFVSPIPDAVMIDAAAERDMAAIRFELAKQDAMASGEKRVAMVNVEVAQ